MQAQRVWWKAEPIGVDFLNCFKVKIVWEQELDAIIQQLYHLSQPKNSTISRGFRRFEYCFSQSLRHPQTPCCILNSIFT